MGEKDLGCPYPVEAAFVNHAANSSPPERDRITALNHFLRRYENLYVWCGLALTNGNPLRSVHALTILFLIRKSSEKC